MYIWCFTLFGSFFSVSLSVPLAYYNFARHVCIILYSEIVDDMYSVLYIPYYLSSLSYLMGGPGGQAPRTPIRALRTLHRVRHHTLTKLSGENPEFNPARYSQVFGRSSAKLIVEAIKRL